MLNNANSSQNNNDTREARVMTSSENPKMSVNSQIKKINLKLGWVLPGFSVLCFFPSVQVCFAFYCGPAMHTAP